MLELSVENTSELRNGKKRICGPFGTLSESHVEPLLGMFIFLSTKSMLPPERRIAYGYTKPK